MKSQIRWGLAYAALVFFSGLVANISMATAAESFEDRVERLRGYWKLNHTNQSRQWEINVLEIVNIRWARDGKGEMLGAFGRLDTKRPYASIDVKESSGAVALSVSIDSGSSFDLSWDGKDKLSGKGKDGGELMFSKSTTAELWDQFSRNPDPRVRAGMNSMIELVYISASNCPYCAGWEAKYLEEGKLRKLPEGAKIAFTQISKVSYGGSISKRYFPEHLQPVRDEIGANKIYWCTLGTTPSFLIVIDGKLRSGTCGSSNFETFVVPLIRYALAEKQSAMQ
ncbi:MAG: hypothetical protein Q8M11_21490 [Sulfuritalea sp.]|nr:hypothetical protein [Sulfuritalea sp.]MDP1983565.1 hypothetical protein [Sulfuritalea sp.]